MKRTLSLIFLLIVILVAVEWGVTFFKTSHHVEYDYNLNNVEYKVIEDYNKLDSNSYSITINGSNSTFSYIVNNNYNKQKKIIDKIEVTDKDKMICISPILLDGKSLEIECSMDNVTYSYEAVKDDNNVLEFVAYLKSKGYNQSMWNEANNEEDEVLSLVRYKNNFISGDVVSVWNYKGISIINDKTSDYEELYNFDKYNNTHGTVVGKYYVTPIYEYDNVNDFSELYIIDLVSYKRTKMKLNETLNQDTFINGVVDNKLYYLDPDNLIQIEIDPDKKSENIVGNKENNARYYDGKWEEINIYDLVSSKKKFNLTFTNNEVLKNYNPKEIIEGKSCFYFSTDDGSYYRLNKTNGVKPVLLFKKNNLKELTVAKDTLYFIDGDTLYYYDMEYGVRKILKNTEWNYNYTNIYNVYKKSSDE